MKLKDILAISGQPGLYKFVAQGGNGVIVESLVDGHRMNVAASAKVSSMGEIAIYTQTEDLPLAKVFENIFAQTSGKPTTITAKSKPEELKAFMAEVLPDFDRERVHVSDMKKLVTWFNLLVDSGFTEFKVENEE